MSDCVEIIASNAAVAVEVSSSSVELYSSVSTVDVISSGVEVEVGASTIVVETWRGPPGEPGEGVAPIEIVSHESITAGQPIRVRTTTGKGSPAQANAIATADVFGFATNSVGADATIEVTRDRVTVADWTAIAGTEFLTPGQTYFLSPTTAGAIQTTPPTTAGHVVCVVGEALSTTTLAVQIGIPILL